jgi:hypothetical protein
MKTLEQWVLRIADSDATWLGLKWLRPDRHQRIRMGYILMSSFLLGLPGVAVGASLIWWFAGRVQPGLWLALFAFVMMLELPLHVFFAHFWNRRAAVLAKTVPVAEP